MKMNRKMQKNLVLTLALSAVCSAVIGVQTFTTAKADVTTDNYFIPGASVRIDADGQNGIKFPVYMTVDAYENLGDVVETGTLVIPADILDGDLTIETENASKAVTTDGWGKITDAQLGEEYYSSVAYLWDIPVSSYTRAITAVGYVKYSDTEYVYTEPVTKSFNAVATAALTDTTQDWTTDEEAMLNSYLEAAPAGTALDFDETAATDGWANPGISASYVESYKGAENVLKLTVTKAGGIGNTKNWKPAYWANYYNAYDTLSMAIYVDGNILGVNYVAQDAYYVEGADDEWQNYNIIASNLSSGWNYVDLTVDPNKTPATAALAFAQYYKVLMNNPMFWINSGTGDLYIDGIYASIGKTVTNAGSSYVAAALGDEITLNDDSATVFAGCTDVSVKVYAPDAIITPENGKFEATVYGDYKVVYMATDANGNVVSASYSITVYNVAQAGKLWDFSSSSVLGSAYPTTVTYLDSYDNESGVVKMSYASAGNDKFHYFGWNKNVFGKDYYAGYEKLVVRVKAEVTSSSFYVIVGRERGWQFDMTAAVYPKGAWQDIELDFGQFYDTKDTYNNAEYDAFDLFVASLYFCARNVTVGDNVYISEIYAVKTAMVTSETIGVAQGNALTIADDSETVFANHTNVTRTVYDPNGYVVEVTGDTFTPAKTGSYKVVYEGLDANYKKVRASYALTVAAATKQIVDLTSDSPFGGYSTSDWTKLTDFDNEANVVKYTEATAGVIYSWAFRGKFLGSQSDYALYTKLVFRIKRDENGGSRVKMYAEKNYTSTGGLNNPGVWVEGITTEWQDIEVDITNFYTYFDGFNSNCNWQTNSDHKAGGSIYIAGIWAK